jgi:hypothetical protein
MPGGKKGKEAAAPPASSSDADAGPSSSSALTTQGAPSTPTPTPSPAEKAALLERIKAQLAAMGMRDAASSAAERQTREAKARYAFWETQPVVQFQGGGGAGGGAGGAAADQQRPNAEDDDEEDGPIDAPKTVADVKKEPYALAPG